MSGLIFPIRETVRVRFESNTGITYIEYNDKEPYLSDRYDHWVGFIIPHDDLPKAVDALQRIEKLLVLK